MDAVEVMEARLAIRGEKECSAIDRVKTSYCEKFDPMPMYDSRWDLANLLHKQKCVPSVEWLCQQQAMQR